MIDSALQLRDRGFAVLPLHPRSKSPLTRHAYKDATRDQEKITAWFAERPDANIAVATGKVSGVVVIDVDGEEGAKALAELEEKYGKLPKTLTATTARGKHYYYEYPKDITIPTSKKLGERLDFKSDGGYCVCPPSVHPDGTTYQWIDADAETVSLPAWVVEKLTATDEKRVSNDAGWGFR